MHFQLLRQQLEGESLFRLVFSSSSSSRYHCSSRWSCSSGCHSNIHDCAACLLSRFSCVRLFATPWTVAPQAPLSMGFPRKEHWSGLPGPLPGDLPNSESNLSLLHWQADSLPPSYLRALSTHYQVSNLIILVILHNRHYYPHFGNEGVQNPKEKWLINTRAWIQP